MPGATVTTGGASVKSSTEVALSGSFAQASATPQEVGFYYGTSSSSMTNKVSATLSGSSFSASLKNLNPGTKYYYQAYVKVAGTGTYASTVSEFKGASASFTTNAASSVKPAVNHAWLELPAATTGTSNVVNTYSAGSDRNYTHLYDKSTYTSMWTAYPLWKGTTGGSRNESWAKNPSTNIPESAQINTWNGSYGVNYSGTINNTIYSRGHQIPDADRSGNAKMQEQTYYATNLVPQVQDYFNGGIWMNLEGGIRGAIPASDTLYVVTGVAFKKVGGNETVTYIKPAKDSKSCPVPNYFWKVVMKVKRSGNTVTSASAVGFWFDHKQYASKDDYANYAVTVDQIEEWTGFDFFVNLPDGVEDVAEDNKNWTTFKNF